MTICRLSLAVPDPAFPRQAAGGEQDISPYLLKLGTHFSQIGDHATAERLFMDGGMFREAIEMYNNAGQPPFLLLLVSFGRLGSTRRRLLIWLTGWLAECHSYYI